jgi:hypothetical protein
VVLELELRAYTLKPLHQPYFCEGFFKIGFHGTICLDWLRTSNLDPPDLCLLSN